MGRRTASDRNTFVRCASQTLLGSFLLVSMALAAPLAQQAPSSNPASGGSKDQGAPAAGASQVFPRGKKLALKDGNSVLVREYKIEGDRIRYYDLDASSWEVMPAALVDWDATNKLESDEASRRAAIVEKVHSQEEARVVQPLDIDASLEVAPGIFLPPGDRLFVFDGKAVLALPQAETNSKISKGRLVEQIMVPVPIVPSRQNVSIQGAHSKFRLRSDQPEFYFRTADAREPHIVLMRAKPKGDGREIEHVNGLFGEKEEVRDGVPLQKWIVAQGVYRFTLGKGLDPGEYAIAQVMDEDGVTLFVWDFGLDPGATAGASPAHPEKK